MTLILKKYFLEKISLLNHRIMRKEKKEKGNTTLFFTTTEPHPRNNSFKKQVLTPPNTN
jgi:hypothetical protein